MGLKIRLYQFCFFVRSLDRFKLERLAAGQNDNLMSVSENLYNMSTLNYKDNFFTGL